MNERLYLAGPEVFRDGALEEGRRRKALCAEHGFVGVYPLDEPLPPQPTPQKTGLAIYRNNRDALRSCDLLVANLTPFRGPSADPGTVFELGMMVGLGRPVFGYSDTGGLLRDRTLASITGARFDPPRDAWVDADGMTIESFGLVDNLMLDGALHDCGGSLLQAIAGEGLLGCLRAARAWLALTPVSARSLGMQKTPCAAANELVRRDHRHKAN